MPTQQEMDFVHMQIAETYATLSKAMRKKVGAVLVTTEGLIIPGYNGTPKGTDNSCEYHVQNSVPTASEINGKWVTKDEVVHSEMNAILKAAKQGVSINGATLYVTLSPCGDRCAPMILQSGIKRVVYKELYRIPDGVQYLKDNGVEVVQI